MIYDQDCGCHIYWRCIPISPDIRNEVKNNQWRAEEKPATKKRKNESTLVNRSENLRPTQYVQNENKNTNKNKNRLYQL